MTRDRNWGPAIGYYDLARIIYPNSGASHNQLAVIALADSNHLRATYHLYRALTVEEPHPGAKGNLEIEFRKAQDVPLVDNVLSNACTSDSQDSHAALAQRFILLHARCYKGADPPGNEDDESEVMRHLAVELKEQSLEGVLSKIVLINIAAQYFAGVRLKRERHEPGVTPYINSIHQVILSLLILDSRSAIFYASMLSHSLLSFKSCCQSLNAM